MCHLFWKNASWVWWWLLFALWIDCLHWHKGNVHIRCHSIGIVDVYLQEAQCHELAGWVSNCSTHSVTCVECATANSNVMSIWKNMCCAHSECLKVSIRVQYEWGKESGVPGCQKTPNYAMRWMYVWFDLFLYTPKHVSDLFSSEPTTERLSANAFGFSEYTP